jgi:diadenosine tetraphosphatase ApaH/serine/threonine PP2A family protein phosphatase
LLRGNHDHAIGTGRLDVGMNRVARQCAEWSISVLRPAELQWLSSLEVEHVDGEWMAVHGAPRDPRKFLAYVYELTYEDNLRYLRQQAVPHCFYGHTHVPLVHVEPPSGPVKLHDSRSVDLRPTWPTLVNPGSVGQPRDGDPRAAFALWDRRAQRVSFHRAVYRVSDTLSDLRARDLPAELQMRLVTGV